LSCGLVAAAAAALACSKSSPSTVSQSASPAGQSASGSSANRALPRGFQSYDNPNGSGHLIYAKFSVSDPSASNSMRDFLGTLNSFFDAPPQLLAAVGNPTDQVVQATLSGNLGGKPVTGIATVVISQTNAIVGLVYDAPAALKTSFQQLYRRLGQEMPQGSSGPFTLAAPQSWQRQTGGDRTAALNLPSGWKVDGITKGIVAVSGPHKEYVELGYTFFVNTMPGSQGMVSRYLEPVPAFTFFVNANRTVTGYDGSVIHQSPGRLIASKAVPAPMQAGKGAYLLQELTVNGVLYKVYALVYTAPPSDDRLDSLHFLRRRSCERIRFGIRRHDAHVGFLEGGRPRLSGADAADSAEHERNARHPQQHQQRPAPNSGHGQHVHRHGQSHQRRNDSSELDHRRL
jgi:hypothetical protein